MPKRAKKSAKSVRVRGYVRKDGTRVKGYTRRPHVAYTRKDGTRVKGARKGKPSSTTQRRRQRRQLIQTYGQAVRFAFAGTQTAPDSVREYSPMFMVRDRKTGQVRRVSEDTIHAYFTIDPNTEPLEQFLQQWKTPGVMFAVIAEYTDRDGAIQHRQGFSKLDASSALDSIDSNVLNKYDKKEFRRFLRFLVDVWGPSRIMRPLLESNGYAAPKKRRKRSKE